MLLTFVQHSQEIVDMYINWGRLITLPQTPTLIYGVLRQSQGYPKLVLQKSPTVLPQDLHNNTPAIPQQHNSNPRQHYSNLTADHTASPQQSHGRPTAIPAIPQQCQGNTTAIPKKSHNNPTAIPSQYHSKPTAISQQSYNSYRNPTAIPQRYQNNHTAIWQQYHSSLTAIP